MNGPKPSKRTIRKTAEQLVLAGKSRQQVYEELRPSSGLADEELANIIRYIPSTEARKRHLTAQTALIGLLVFTVLLKLLAAFGILLDNVTEMLPWVLFMPVVNIVLAIGVAMHRGMAYKMVALLTSIGLLQGAAAIFSSPLWVILIELGLAAALIGFSLFLLKRMVPDHTTVKERYINAHGQERLRNVIRFKEYGE
jgi:hypothetical protein